MIKKLLGLTTLVLASNSSFALGAKSPGNSNRPTGYEYVDPSNLVPSKALTKALEGYDSRKSWLRNLNYLTVIDYSQHSGSQRFYLIDMKTGKVNRQAVAHGTGSDSNHDGYAEKFSNVSGSKATSLGFFTTASTYQGSNGHSLILDGLSSTNSNARSRAIVIHGADYVSNNSSKQGRSWGCPALPHSVNVAIIEKIKNGSLVFSYHKDFN